jgi:hypothetical protein
VTGAKKVGGPEKFVGVEIFEMSSVIGYVEFHGVLVRSKERITKSDLFLRGNKRESMVLCRILRVICSNLFRHAGSLVLFHELDSNESVIAMEESFEDTWSNMTKPMTSPRSDDEERWCSLRLFRTIP